MRVNMTYEYSQAQKLSFALTRAQRKTIPKEEHAWASGPAPLTPGRVFYARVARMHQAVPISSACTLAP